MKAVRSMMRLVSTPSRLTVFAVMLVRVVTMETVAVGQSPDRLKYPDFGEVTLSAHRAFVRVSVTASFDRIYLRGGWSLCAMSPGSVYGVQFLR